jgi:hypothetical protein
VLERAAVNFTRAATAAGGRRRRHPDAAGAAFGAVSLSLIVPRAPVRADGP